jgi:tetratricopeptide (TPR) repeat protein
MGKPSPLGGVIIARQMKKHKWILRFPRITGQVDDKLRKGINWLRSDPQCAECVFLELISDYPEYLDAYHYWALALERKGDQTQADQVREKAIKMALTFFPAHFAMDQDQLAWGFEENRPFLRLYHSFGLQLMEKGKTEEALNVFENMLVLNPNDNQGVRALLVGCHFALKQPYEVLSVCRQFPDDAMEHLLYGRALALFQGGEVKETEEALDFAIKSFPLIAKELLKAKHRKPKGTAERYVTLGSSGQAFLYWQEHGQYWIETPGAIEFVRSRCFGKGTKTV